MLWLLRPPESSSLLRDMASAGAFGEVGASYFVHPEREGLEFLMDKQWASCSNTLECFNNSFADSQLKSIESDIR